MVLLFPTMLSTMMCLMISAEWMFLGEGKLAKLMLSGEINLPFAITFFMCGVIGLSTIATTLILVIPKASDIDDLNAAQREAYLAKLRYEEVTRKIVKNIYGRT